VSPHDSLGANLVVQVKGSKVMRVVPLENEDVNECWISDRDRFSYEGLNSEERLTRPMIRQDGAWQEVEWQDALEFVANGLKQVKREKGAGAIGALVAPHSTLEEMALAAGLMRALGSDNVDFRLRQCDFAQDGKRAGAPWLGMKVADLNTLDRILLVGSFLRKDHPLMAQRIRQAVKRGAQASVVHACDDDLLMPIANRMIVAPADLAHALTHVVAAVAAAKGVTIPSMEGFAPSNEARGIAASLMSGQKKAVLLGNLAVQHPQAANVHALAQWIAEQTGATLGVLGEAANSVGGYLARALPAAGGLNAGSMIAAPRAAYLLVNAEPEFDCADTVKARAAMDAADLVVMLTPYKSGMEYADVLLPVAPFTETSGTYVNAEGRVQSFNGTVMPLGEARPAWKVLRVLGNLIGAPGFDYETSEEVRHGVLGGGDLATRMSNRADIGAQAVGPSGVVLERLADVPIYCSDAIVRRASSLQLTTDARIAPRARVNGALLARLGLSEGDSVRIRNGSGSVVLPVARDDRVPATAVRVAAGHAATAGLGAMFGPLTMERA
jgi:NADH-quinone oxidoreductase subunit G